MCRLEDVMCIERWYCRFRWLRTVFLSSMVFSRSRFDRSLWSFTFYF